MDNSMEFQKLRIHAESPIARELAAIFQALIEENQALLDGEEPQTEFMRTRIFTALDRLQRISDEEWNQWSETQKSATLARLREQIARLDRL